ncbi:hypothetical protein EDC01DRAFT_777870 [Geopyxis carbonaria]|nr:hypothetical protein EDC01DRAFT_777870 [Geopyxis carbonaria]
MKPHTTRPARPPHRDRNLSPPPPPAIHAMSISTRPPRPAESEKSKARSAAAVAAVAAAVVAVVAAVVAVAVVGRTSVYGAIIVSRGRRRRRRCVRVAGAGMLEFLRSLRLPQPTSHERRCRPRCRRCGLWKRAEGNALCVCRRSGVFRTGDRWKRFLRRWWDVAY